MSSQFRNKDHSNSDSDSKEEKKKKDFKERAESLLVGTDKPKDMLVPEGEDPVEDEKFSFDEAKTTECEQPIVKEMLRNLSTPPSEKDLTQGTKAYQIRRVRTKSENDQLMDWIQNHKYKKIKASLKEDSSLRHSVDDRGRTLLHISAECGNVTAANYVLAISDVDARDSNGRTALMLAVLQNHANVVKMLLSAGSDIDVLDNEGKDVLHLGFAKKEPTTKVVDLLLLEIFKRCAGIETIAEKLVNSGCQLHQAMRVTSIALIKSMLARDVNVDTADPETKYTALHMSVILHYPEMVKVLLEAGADAETLDNHGESPLYHNYLRPRTSGQQNQLEILDLLLARRVSLTATTQSGMLQVSTTLMNGCAEAIARLLRSGYLDFSVLDAKDGSRAIHYLTMNCNPSVTEQLKLHAAERDYHVNATDKHGFVPLHRAVIYGNVEMLHYLLEQGVDANYPMVTSTLHNFTPIYLCRNGPVLLARECLEVLLQHKADPQACLTDGDGKILGTLFDLEHRNIMLRPVVAHLAMIERQGEPITKLIFDKIHSRAEIRKYFVRCQAVLNGELFGSITVLNLLTDSEKKVMGYLSNPKLRLKLKKLNKKLRIQNSFWYYFHVLRKRVVKLLRLRGLRNEAAGIVCKWFENPLGEKHIVIERMLDFLDVSSLEQLTSL